MYGTPYIAKARAAPAAALKLARVMTREQQILDRLPQVKMLAMKTLRRLPANSVPLDDLISAGTIGLIAAVDHFDPARNIKLNTYAEYKIRGAIADSLRKLDPQTREARQFARARDAAIEILEQQLERAPDDTEIADALGLELLEYDRQRAAATIRSHPIDHVRAEDGYPLAMQLPSSAATPEEEAGVTEDAERIRELVARLPERERFVIELYFWEGYSLRVIALRFGVSEGRASQIRTAALDRLRQLAAREQLPAAA